MGIFSQEFQLEMDVLSLELVVERLKMSLRSGFRSAGELRCARMQKSVPFAQMLVPGAFASGQL